MQLPGGMEEKAKPYSAQLIASGGTPPYSWTATGLSSGLALSPAGVISGTPVPGSAGAVPFQATVMDADGTTQTSAFAIPIASNAGQLTITSPATLPDAGAGLAYATALTASGGRPPYVWSETSVGLGLTLSSSGSISGTASAPATLGFTGQVTDATGATASRAFSLSVVPKFGITTSSPLRSGNRGCSLRPAFWSDRRDATVTMVDQRRTAGGVGIHSGRRPQRHPERGGFFFIQRDGA